MFLFLTMDVNGYQRFPFFQISSIVFNRTTTTGWYKSMVSKRWQNFPFWVNCSFKLQLICSCSILSNIFSSLITSIVVITINQTSIFTALLNNNWNKMRTSKWKQNFTSEVNYKSIYLILTQINRRYSPEALNSMFTQPNSKLRQKSTCKPLQFPLHHTMALCNLFILKKSAD